MKKTISKKNAGEVESKRLMFAPIIFESVEAATTAGFVPETALTDKDVEGCEVVFEDNENE